MCMHNVVSVVICTLVHSACTTRAQRCPPRPSRLRAGHVARKSSLRPSTTARAVGASSCHQVAPAVTCGQRRRLARGGCDRSRFGGGRCSRRRAIRQLPHLAHLTSKPLFTLQHRRTLSVSQPTTESKHRQSNAGLPHDTKLYNCIYHKCHTIRPVTVRVVYSIII